MPTGKCNPQLSSKKLLFAIAGDQQKATMGKNADNQCGTQPI